MATRFQSVAFTPPVTLRMIQWRTRNEGRGPMQPIMEIASEALTRIRVKPKLRRMPIMSSNLYPLTVFCWVLAVATTGVVVGVVCTEFFGEYTALLRDLGTGS